MVGFKSRASEDRLGWIHRARGSILLGSIAVAVCAPAGCGLLLDPGDHYLKDGIEAGTDASVEMGSTVDADDATNASSAQDGELEVNPEDAGPPEDDSDAPWIPDADAGDDSDAPWIPDADAGDESDAPWIPDADASDEPDVPWIPDADGGPDSDAPWEADADGGPDSDGPRDPECIVKGQQRPGAIGIVNGYVFWLNETDGNKPGSLMRADLDGQNVTTLLSNRSNPTDLWVLGVGLYFTEDFGGLDASPGVFKVDQAGQDVRPLADDHLGAGAIHAVNPWVYSEAWSRTTAPSIRKSSITSATPNTCYPYTGNVVGSRIRAVRGDHFADYIWFADDATSQIRRISADCDGGSYEVYADNQSSVRAIVESENNVYWITANKLLKLHKDEPGLAPLVLSTGHTDLSAVCGGIAALPGETQWKLALADAGANTVWFIDRTTNPDRKVVIASNQHEPRGVAGSGNFVYWTNRASGEICRAPVP
jgi:hypothetical protein